MRQLKPGKYVGHTFTEDQKKARRWWRRQGEMEVDIRRALQLLPNIIDPSKDRERLHKKLDAVLNDIEMTRKRAEKLFPDVNESFTISSTTISI